MEPLDATRRPEIEPLLLTAQNAVRNGHHSIARTLFRAIVREFPADTRGWCGLADVAANPDDAYEALEQAAALDPDDDAIRNRLEQLAAQLGRTPPAPPPTAAPPESPFGDESFVAAFDLDDEAAAAFAAETPSPRRATSASADEGDSPPRFPLLNRIAIVVILVLIVIIGWLIGRSLFADSGPPDPAPITQPSIAPIIDVAPIAPTAGVLPTLIPSELPLPAEPAPDLPTIAAVAPTAAPTGPTTEPVAPANRALPLGSIATVDDWNITLLRPEYALLLDGGIGDLRPQGRFVLALIAISNERDVARPIPADLFSIVDRQGRAVAPAPGASTVFLSTYGRGQYGDLALEDAIAARSGMRTVPLIFDVPLDAEGLLLQAGDSGWPIEGAASQPAGP